MNPSTEPVLTAGTIAGIVGAIVTLLVTFGVHITDEQRNAFIALAVLLVPIVAAAIARMHVVPVSKLQEVPAGPTALTQVEAAKT